MLNEKPRLLLGRKESLEGALATACKIIHMGGISPTTMFFREHLKKYMDGEEDVDIVYM